MMQITTRVPHHLLPEELSQVIKLDQFLKNEAWAPHLWKNLEQSRSESSILFLLGTDLDYHHGDGHGTKRASIIGFTLFFLPPGDSVAHLLKIVVVPTWQGQGLGQELLKTSMDLLKKRGVKSLYLEVRSGNEKALKLYQKFFFKVYHHQKNFYSDGHSALKMGTIL